MCVCLLLENDTKCVGKNDKKEEEEGRGLKKKTNKSCKLLLNC